MHTRNVLLSISALLLGIAGSAFPGSAGAQVTSCPIQPQSTGGMVASSLPGTCEPGGGGTTPPATPTIYVGDECSLPGPYADNRCTVLFHVRNNPANNKVCVWHGNNLVSCEGRTFWGGGFDWVTTAGTSVEFRRHAVWPTQDPDWPNAQVVRAKGTLLKTEHVVARHRAFPSGTCDTTVQPGSSIQAALDTGVDTVCLAAGLHVTTTNLVPKPYQTIRSATAQRATIRPAAGLTTFQVLVPGVTLGDITIDGLATARPSWGVLVYGASDVLLEGLEINRATIAVGISEGASDVELRDSHIVDAGDGQACSGCAHPSVWINASSDVRVVSSAISNTGVGPEGDGELACYGTPGLVVQNSTIADSGAAGMYIVNCDHAIVIGNMVDGSKEWGIDVVDTGQPSGTDFGLFQWNTVQYSGNGGVVMLDSLWNTFTNNTYRYNLQRPGGSGSCHGVNRRGNTSGFFQFNDTATPWPVSCSD